MANSIFAKQIEADERRKALAIRKTEEAEQRKRTNEENAKKAAGRAVELQAGSMEGYLKKQEIIKAKEAEREKERLLKI